MFICANEFTLTRKLNALNVCCTGSKDVSQSTKEEKFKKNHKNTFNRNRSKRLIEMNLVLVMRVIALHAQVFIDKIKIFSLDRRTLIQ